MFLLFSLCFITFHALNLWAVISCIFVTFQFCPSNWPFGCCIGISEISILIEPNCIIIQYSFFIFNSDFQANRIALHSLKDVNITRRLCLGLPRCPTPSYLRLKLRIPSTPSTVLTTGPTHPTTLHFITRKLFCGKYKSLSSPIGMTKFSYRRSLPL